MAPYRRPWRWLARHPWVTSLVMVAVFAAGAGYRDLNRQSEQRAYDRCVSAWADELGTRATSLTRAADDLWRTMAALLTHPDPGNQRVFGEHLGVYLHTSDTHPVPEPPTLRCGR